MHMFLCTGSCIYFRDIASTLEMAKGNVTLPCTKTYKMRIISPLIAKILTKSTYLDP